MVNYFLSVISVSVQGRLGKNHVKVSIKRLGLSRDDAQSGNKWRIKESLSILTAIFQVDLG